VSVTESRRRRLAAAIAALDLDALLVTRLVNVRYLTGFTGSNGALLLHSDGRVVLATDGRYTEQAQQQAPDLSVRTDRNVVGALAKGASGRLGFEEHDLTVSAYDALHEQLADSSTELRRSGQLVESLRQHKDEDEVATLARAAAVADQALADCLPRIRPGVTEAEVARALEDRMRDLGAEAPAFDTIVASGPNGAMPHHGAADRPLATGDLVTIDFGARVDGYHSDMTRTIALGPVAAWQQELYDLVREAQRQGRRALAVGAETRAVDAAARAVIEAAGHGANYPHGLGHGVGLEIHEAPMIGSTSTATLDEAVPVTVEPGVYLPGRGGCRIEDTLVVRADGPELLTTTTKDLLVL
jgi:Xaa-Pro aminopeptidase